jgi:hypothetical protein
MSASNNIFGDIYTRGVYAKRSLHKIWRNFSIFPKLETPLILSIFPENLEMDR